MLIKFEFGNYKSFRDYTTLNLGATKITEHSEHVTTSGSEKILPVSLIYGGNASGKSTVYQAFEYMSHYVITSFKFGGDNDSKQESEFKLMKPKPFLFDKTSKSKETYFQVHFIDDSESNLKTYKYGFTVNENGIAEEWLNSKAKSSKEYRRLFYRSDNMLDLSGISSKYRRNIEISLEKETLIVSLGAKLKIPKLKKIRDWFWDNEFVDFGDPMQSLVLSRLLPKGFVEEKTVQEDVLKFLDTFDNSIKGFNIEKVVSDSEDKDEVYKIDALHSIIDSQEMIALPLHSESDGTLKMFALYTHLQSVLKAGSVIFIDELNARLHPLLVKNFIQVFLNKNSNPNGAQLIFTTHDTWQLSNDLLRRDEIWFTDKDITGISSLYSLADITDEEGVKIRKDENFEKNYLAGKYRAIPKLKEITVDLN